MKKAIIGLIAAMVIVVLSASGAGAHHPEVGAVNQCITNTPVITVTTTAWENEDPLHRVNTAVLVTARNVANNESQVVATGQFNAGNGYTFSAYFIGSTGATYVIRSTAQNAWGPNQEFGSQGEFRETTITQLPTCLENPVPPPNTVTPPPTTTIAPPTTAKQVTTVPQGTTFTQTRRETELARTGRDYKPWITAGVIIAGLGIFLVIADRKKKRG